MAQMATHITHPGQNDPNQPHKYTMQTKTKNCCCAYLWMGTVCCTCMNGHRWYLYGGFPNGPRCFLCNYLIFGWCFDCCAICAMTKAANAEISLMKMQQQQQPNVIAMVPAHTSTAIPAPLVGFKHIVCSTCNTRLSVKVNASKVSCGSCNTMLEISQPPTTTQAPPAYNAE